MASATPVYSNNSGNAYLEPQEGPQSASQHQTPLLPSGRACEECHRKKTRCDMLRPSCRLCVRIGSSCIYPTRRKRPSFAVHKSAKSTRSVHNLTRLLELLEQPHHEDTNADRDIPQVASSLLGQRSANTTQGALETESAAPSLSDHQADGQSECSTTLRPDGVDYHQEDDPDSLYSFSASVLKNQREVLPSEESEESKEYQPHDAVSFELATELIKTFFRHIQPWLPILHEDRFLNRCRRDLRPGADALINLPTDLKLLLYSIFALAARFSPLPTFSAIPPLERDQTFLLSANEAYGAIRKTDCVSLTYLQGCVLLAFNAHVTKYNIQAWILTGVCVRLAYDLGLSEIDEQDSDAPSLHDWIELEEKRRVWWAIWELDTFGSIISKRPFAIDRHCFSVKLPVADVDWFNGTEVQSNYLSTSLHQCAMSLHGSENQSPRAWFLTVNHLLSLVHEKIRRKRSLSQECWNDLLVTINCMKLALPASFDILSSPPPFNFSTIAECNWIFGTHLMLVALYAMIDEVNPDNGINPSPIYSELSRVLSRDQNRLSSQVQLVARWPVEYMTAAHPFYIWLMIPHVRVVQGQEEPSRNFSTMVKLILKRFSSNWKLAGEALAVMELMGKPERATVEQTALMRRFAYFFYGKSSNDGRFQVVDQNPSLDFASLDSAMLGECGHSGAQISGVCEELTYESNPSQFNVSFPQDDRCHTFNTTQPYLMPLQYFARTESANARPECISDPAF